MRDAFGHVYQKLNVKKCIQCWTSCWKQFLFKHSAVSQTGISQCEMRRSTINTSRGGALGLFNQTFYSQKRWKVPGPEISICNLSHISSHEDNFHLIQTKLFLESLQNEALALIARNCMQFIIPHLLSISCQWQVYFLSQSEASNSFYEPMRSLVLAGLGSEGQEGYLQFLLVSSEMLSRPTARLGCLVSTNQRPMWFLSDQSEARIDPGLLAHLCVIHHSLGRVTPFKNIYWSLRVTRVNPIPPTFAC